MKFSGGTYSSHPASLLAAKTMMTYLAEHEQEIYGQLGELGAKACLASEGAFAAEGIFARCTGQSAELPWGSSMVHLHFPYSVEQPLECPEDVFDPALCDPTLSEHVLRLALLQEDVHTVHGLGSLTCAHTEGDLARLAEACRRVARRIKPYLAPASV